MARIWSSGFELHTMKFHWWNRLWWKIKPSSLIWHQLAIKGPTTIQIDGIEFKIPKGGYLKWHVKAPKDPLNSMITKKQ